MVRGDQQSVRDREDRLLVTTMTRDPAIASGEGTVGRANRRERGFDERRPQLRSRPQGPKSALQLRDVLLDRRPIKPQRRLST